ncbi:MAG: Beta-galactosidase, partial [Verrucomicrobiota bacterium]
MKISLISLLCLPCLAVEPMDLSGTWRFAADPQDHGANATREQWRFPDTITLPGHVAAQGFGEKPSFEMKWTGEGWKYPELFKEWQSPENFKMPFFLQPPLRYEGPAWFQRDIEIPESWQGDHAILHLERVHWQSRVWVNGKLVGNANFLGCPHEFDLGPLPPGKHELTLRIDNRIGEINPGPLSHSVTDHTQGNWNGVVGRIELRPVPAHHITHLRVEPSFSNKSVWLIVETNATTPGKVSARVRYLGPHRDFFETSSLISKLTHGSAEILIPLGRDPRPWNEFTPHLYQAEVIMETSAGSVTRSATFGFRDTSVKNGRLAINGLPLFLRGTLECCIFPLTGHPPTDVDSWRRIIRICKSHGLNHIRFHSWCPPEAAFIAADELGFYYQVEASTWPNQGAELGSGWQFDQWLDAETGRMIQAYGNHPSFLMMASGNEPGGPNHAEWLREYVARWKVADARRFWTTAANWPVIPGSDYHNPGEPRIQGWGQGLSSVINAQSPRTDFDWSGYLAKVPGVPVISHEIGQWCVYPNFDEIKKYTGWFKPKNFEIFRETARRNGLLDQSRDIMMASGKLQVLCYKHDIEAAMRTPGFGGFQLLDLRDFPGQGSALVGVLDPFWDGKGYISPEEFASFSGPIVPLARLPKLVFTSAETLAGDYLLSHFGADDLTDITPTWSLRQGQNLIAEGTLPARDLAAGELHSLGSISIDLSKVPAPAKLTLTLGAEGQSFANSWSVFVFPAQTEPEPVGDIMITRSLAEAMAALEKGATVLWNPPASEIADDPSRPLVAGFSSIFWNTAWTQWQPPHTLGILCDPS